MKNSKGTRATKTTIARLKSMARPYRERKECGRLVALEEINIYTLLKNIVLNAENLIIWAEKGYIIDNSDLKYGSYHIGADNVIKVFFIADEYSVRWFRGLATKYSELVDVVMNQIVINDINTLVRKMYQVYQEKK